MSAIGYHIARKVLYRLSREHVLSQPQLACHAFDLITLYIHLDGKYERDELDLLSRLVFPTLPGGGACLDVGANIGNHSVHFARHFRQVVSLEPHPRNFALLEVNARLADNIRPVNLGASDRAASVEIVEDRTNLAGSSMHRSAGRDGGKATFRLDRIDEMAEVRSAGRIDFMKLDIEGHEAQAIAGAEATLRRDRPIVMLEILKDEISGGTSASLEALRKLGYRHFHIAVEAGTLGALPVRVRKPLRALAALFTGRRLSKAARLVRIDRLEPRNYLMVLCACDQPDYAA